MPATSRRPREKMWIRRNKGRWTSEEHAAFLHGLRLYQRDNWAAVASVVPTRAVLQVRTHAQKYFNKVDKGEDFPEEPYPSQYSTESGKSGAAAGAYLYGVPKHDQQQQQRQPREDAFASTPTEQPLTFSPPPLDGSATYESFGGGVVPELRYPTGLLTGSEHQQRTAAAGVVSTAAAAAEPTALTGVDGGYMVSPSAHPCLPYGGGGGGGGGGDPPSPFFAALPQGSTSSVVQHSHAYPSAALVGVEAGGLRWVGSSGGSAGQSASASTAAMSMPHHGSIDNARTNDNGRGGSYKADGSTSHYSATKRRNSNNGNGSGTNTAMGPAGSISSCSWTPYTGPAPLPFWDPINPTDASAASSAASDFPGDSSFSLSFGGSFKRRGSNLQQDAMGYGGSPSGGGSFAQRGGSGAPHRESAYPSNLQWPPIFGGPAARGAASSIDLGKTSSQQQEEQALVDLNPFSSWLDMPLLGDGDFPCGEFDDRNGDDNGVMMGGDSGDIGLEDFGVL